MNHELGKARIRERSFTSFRKTDKWRWGELNSRVVSQWYAHLRV